MSTGFLRALGFVSIPVRCATTPAPSSDSQPTPRVFVTGVEEKPYSFKCAKARQFVQRRWQNTKIRLGDDPAKLRNRKKIVVLGTGWGAVNFLRFVDPFKYDVTVISPRNYFVMTPLLPSVCAGTLSPRSCMEPVRGILARGGKPVIQYHEAKAESLDAAQKKVRCIAPNGEAFDVEYDALVMAVGAQINTFGIPGVEDHSHFLKEVENAREVRLRLIENFERASLPGASEEEKRRLLHFLFVGGGPTGAEAAAEVADFIREDVPKHFPSLLPYVKLTLVEMLPKILPMFSEKVSEYAVQNLRNVNVDTRLRSAVTKIDDDFVYVRDAEGVTHKMPYGLVLWASGVAQIPFSKTVLQTVESQKGNRVVRVDEKLRMKGADGVFALGDCAMVTPDPLQNRVNELYERARTSPKGAGTAWLRANQSGLSLHHPQIDARCYDFSKKPSKENLSKDAFLEILKEIDEAYKIPAPTAQNAKHAGRYLAAVMNDFGPEGFDRAPAFHAHWNGALAYVGGHQAVADLPGDIHLLGGMQTLLLWRSLYWWMQLSHTNRMLCLLDWIRVAMVGREIGRDHTGDRTRPEPIAPLRREMLKH